MQSSNTNTTVNSYPVAARSAPSSRALPFARLKHGEQSTTPGESQIQATAPTRNHVLVLIRLPSLAYCGIGSWRVRLHPEALPNSQKAARGLLVKALGCRGTEFQRADEPQRRKRGCFETESVGARFWSPARRHGCRDRNTGPL
jgi:hypothetical protein